MMAMTCPAEHELLPLLSQEPGASELREHVASCSSCRRRLQQLDGEVRAIRENRQEASLPPWSDLISHVGLELASARTDPDETADYRPGDPLPSTAADAGNCDETGPSALPARIGKYLVVGEFDDGGQATVYRVVHPGIGRDLALKLAKKRVDERETDFDLSASEAKILGDLDHPGLVRVVDLGIYEGRMFLVMDYVRGKNLQQFAKDRPVTAREAARLVIQAAGAAEAVHRRGIERQDIKPKNILVDESGRARLIDFGLARWHHAWSECAEGPSGGTPEFMAPEQARGDQDRIGPRTDVFALGAVLYFLLTGQAPFQAGNRLETLARARRNDFDREALKKSRVPRRLERIVLKAMAAEPESRHASAEAFARDLGSFLRRPQPLGAAAAILFAAAVPAVGWSVWPPPPKPPDHHVVIVNPPPVPPPLTGELSLWVWEEGNPQRQGLALPDRGAMPLKSDDRVRVEAKVNRPAYLYLFWIEADGVPQPMYPWKPGNWTELAEPDQPVRQVSLPKRGTHGWPIKKGHSGMETLLLLARETPLPANVSLRDHLGGLPATGIPDPRLLVRFDDWMPVQAGGLKPSGSGTISASPDRGPQFVDVEVKDALLQTQALLKERLARHFSMVRAVSFANQGG